MRVERRGGMVALQQVDGRQDDQEQPGDQGPDHDAVGGQPVDDGYAFGRPEHRGPEHDDDHGGRIDAAMRERRRYDIR